MPLITTSITLDGQTCILPEGIPTSWKASGKASSLTCPIGPAPTRGWFLLDRAGHDALGEGPLSIVWTVQNLTDSTTTATAFSGLYPIDHGRQGFGGVGDQEAIFLVELVDGRYWAAGASDTGLIAANIRSYSHDNVENGARSFLTDASGDTWASLASSLWGTCPQLGAFPGLPYAPDWIPEGQRFIGTNGFKSLCALLDFLDCAIVHNVTAAGDFSIVQLGSAQAIAAHTEELKWDAELRSFPTGFAGNVATYFPSLYLPYGQERDAELNRNWSVRDFAGEGFRYATSGGGAGIAGGLGTVPRWQDLPRLINNKLEDINGGRRTARSSAVVTRYGLRYGVERKHRIYWGIVTDVLPGGQVRACQWRNTNGMTETEIVASPHLPRDGEPVSGAADAQPTENYAGHDLARHTTPTYPRLPNIVQVYNGGSAGSLVDPVAAGDIFVHHARVRRWAGEQMRILDDCALLFVDDFDNKAGELQAIEGEYYGPARLTGTVDLEGQIVPLYKVRKGSDSQELVFFELLSDLDLDGAADAEILSGAGDDWVASGQFIIVQDSYELPGMWQAFTGYRGFARKHPTGDKYDVVWMERIAQWVFYQLTDDLAKTDPMDPFNFETQAPASVVHYHDQGKDPGETITVFYRSTEYLAWHVEGCFGWAHWNDRDKRYEITTPQLQCVLIEGTLKYNLCGTEEFPQEAENLASRPWGIHSFREVEFDEDDTIAFENPRNHRGTVGAGVTLLGYKAADEDTELTWLLIDIDLVEVSVVTNISKPPGECAIRGSTLKVYLETCGVAGDDVGISLTSVEAVKSHTLARGTREGTPYCELTVVSETLCVFDAVDGATTTTALQKQTTGAELVRVGDELTWVERSFFVFCTLDDVTGTPVPLCCGEGTPCEGGPCPGMSDPVDDLCITFESDCPGLDGQTLTLVWSSGDAQWEGVLVIGETAHANIALGCNGVIVFSIFDILGSDAVDGGELTFDCETKTGTVHYDSLTLETLCTDATVDITIGPCV